MARCMEKYQQHQHEQPRSHGNHHNGPLAYHKGPVVETIKLKLSDRLHCVHTAVGRYYSEAGSSGRGHDSPSFTCRRSPHPSCARLNDRIFAAHYTSFIVPHRASQLGAIQSEYKSVSSQQVQNTASIAEDVARQ